MGVGYPVDLVVCSCLGVDMFDCVFATRTARFGQVFTRQGFLRLKPEEMKLDLSPLDSECTCPTCIKYSKSFLSGLFNKEQTACHLLSIHNIYFLFTIMREMRENILSGTLDQYVRTFIINWHNGLEHVPDWVKDALAEANIQLS